MAMHEWGFRAAHIPESVHYATVEDADQDLDHNDEIVVYCTDPSCVASQFAYRWLVDAGYSNVRRYAGGLSDWVAAGYELEGDSGSGGDSGVFFFAGQPGDES